MFMCSKTFYWAYLRNGWSVWCEMKRMCIDWMLDQPCDLAVWPHWWPRPWISMVKFLTTCILGMDGMSEWIKMKRKWSNWMLGWLYMTSMFDHTHDLDLVFSRSKFVIALSQELAMWNVRNVSLSFMIMTVKFVWPLWGGWRYTSAWSDFKPQSAVDISSL